jgi:hypothetical protein
MTDASELQIMSEIQGHMNIRRRAIAVVQNARWDDEKEDVTAPIEIDALMWAVATNNTVMGKVKDALDAAPEGDEANIDRAIMAGVEDGDLTYIITTVAMPRLEKKSKGEEA